MKRVVLGDECVLADGGASAAASITPALHAGAAQAIARLNQAGCTVVLTSHFTRPPQVPDADAVPPPIVLRHGFWHALADAGAHVDAVFFWPESAADMDEGFALFDEIGIRYGTEASAWHALFADSRALHAAHAAGCHAVAVTVPGTVAETSALPPGLAPAADLATCVARIVAQADAAGDRVDDTPTPAAA